MKTTNSLIKFLGGAYILLGIIRVLNYTKIEFRFLFSFALAGFWFIVFDFFVFLVNDKFKMKSPRMMKAINNLPLILWALSMVVIPFLPIKWNNYVLRQINDAIVFWGLGIVAILLGMKSDMELKNYKDDKNKND
ncbi:hypothetical protein C1I60_06675 [Paenibacillus terrae]|uniref:Uncharacterized protein n=1 Tax=Paenibacillus terrae TaxID=159743 RepID=A0A4U2Q053_9BACL|nr:hypothetical protein [Paenibacillus terrae]TKH45377.1 hypothetical protein C1I60_06675 [Paenibacillus terrae]